MAGSNTWFAYISDSGVEYAIFGDESNIEGANDAAAVQPTDGVEIKPPRNMRVRTATYSNSSRTRSLRVPILTIDTYTALTTASTIPDTIAGGGTLLNLVRKRPEIISPIPTLYDTGLSDGDGTAPVQNP